MQQPLYISPAITECSFNGLWGFYPEAIELKKKKKCCKKFKTEKRCKKCPANG
jgi:hypothetical protein